MYATRLYPDFSRIPTLSGLEHSFLDTLQSVNKSCHARFTNFLVFDYDIGPMGIEHYLTYPSDWMVRYLTNGYSRLDPIYGVDFRQHSIVDWQDYRDQHNESFFSAMAEFGISENAISVACHIDKKRQGVLNLLFTNQNSDWEHFKRENMDLYKHECERVVAQYLQSFAKEPRQVILLTPREKECLYWAAIGKTDEQIANLLGTSKWTVNSQFQNAKTKLNAPNRTAAVAMAISQQLIEIKHAG